MPVESTRFIFVPEKTAERHRRAREARTEKYARYNKKRSERPGQTQRVAYKDRRFIVWDGEGPRDTGYSLLGNSEGMEICYPKLTTRDCLNLILETGNKYPDTIHVSFGFTYDVSCILWELSWAALNRLYKFNRTFWHGYVIEHVPRKWFTVRKDGVSVKIFDIQSFFATSLVDALENWSIGPWMHVDITENVPTFSVVSNGSSHKLSGLPPIDTVMRMSERQMVETFKSLRSEFFWKDIESIRLYMRLELKYTKQLIEEVRNAFVGAGYLPHSWHGPGAVARMAFRRHGIYNVLCDTPLYVRRAAQYAFVAGRFELLLAGHVGPVYTADLNSAYPWFCSQLPNLSHGKWRHTVKYEPGKFAVWHIKYEHHHRPDCNRGNSHRSRIFELYPLPKREKTGNVVWGPSVTGWYWNPEAALVVDDPDAVFLEGWVFDEDNPKDRPFAWIADYFAQRRIWKDVENPAEYTLKLIINSIYGQLAQRVGWDQKKKRGPRTHQLEYAGWITSSCRAAVYAVARACGDNLVSIDTDGVTSQSPFTWLTNSKEFGQWELSEYEDSIFWQSGIYMLKEEGEWKKARTRGIAKGSYSAEDLFTCLRDGTALKLTKRVFISYGIALNGQHHLLNQWIEEPHEIKMGGSGKRIHYRSRCDPDTGGRCSGNPIHRLALPTIRGNYFTAEHSQKHRLPWVDSPADMSAKNLITRMVLFDTNALDPEDEWSLTYE